MGKGPFVESVYNLFGERIQDIPHKPSIKGGREFKRQLNSYLRKKINLEKRHIRSVGFLNSANSSLIQLADMVAGAINRSQGDKGDAKDYIKIVQHREAHLQIWPNPKNRKPKS